MRARPLKKPLSKKRRRLIKTKQSFYENNEKAAASAAFFMIKFSKLPKNSFSFFEAGYGKAPDDIHDVLSP